MPDTDEGRAMDASLNHDGAQSDGANSEGGGGENQTGAEASVEKALREQVANLERQRNEANSRADRALNAQEQLLAKISETTNTATAKEPEIDLAQIASEWDEKGGEAILRDVLSFQDEREKKLLAEYEAKLTAKEKAFAEQLASIAARVDQYDPDVRVYKDRIEKLKEDPAFAELPSATLLAIAKREKGANVARPELPGNTSSSARTMDAGDMDISQASADMAIAELEKITGHKYTSAEKAEFRRKRQ